MIASVLLLLASAAVLYLFIAFRRCQARGTRLAQVGWFYLALAADLALLP
jgi:hypothetical protein